MIKVALVNPEIPPNTGNIARLCVACDAELHLVRPLGFSLSDRYLKRAGLDYWQHLRLTVHESLDTFLAGIDGRACFFSSKGSRSYTTVAYTGDDWLVFGAETAGFPARILEEYGNGLYTIPMFGKVRCLNLSNAVAVVVYEALRQTKHF